MLIKQKEVYHFGMAKAEKISYLKQHHWQIRASDYSRLKALGNFGRVVDEARVVSVSRFFIFP